MESYRTEEEQVEALRRWWDENGRSTIAAIVVALAAGFGWQAWKGHNANQNDAASDIYQAMLQVVSVPDMSEQQAQMAVELGEQLKNEYAGSTYAQFAAMQLARNAVGNGDLAGAEAQLRWVLGKTEAGSDTGQIAQLRLARVLASSGDPQQALAILEQAGEGNYQASYTAARGDILMGLGREDEAREAYESARLLAAAGGGMQQGMSSLVDQKLQSLNPVPPREFQAQTGAAPAMMGGAPVEDAETEQAPDNEQVEPGAAEE